jgi:hypothetical protein
LPIPIRFTARAEPLVARAAVARGDAAGALARRLLALDDDGLAALTGVAGAVGDDVVCAVLGDAAALPWVDGVAYLGRDDAAPGLLLPTAVAPDVAPGLLERAVRARAGAAAAPIGVIAGEGGALAALVPLGAARRFDRAQLAAWLAREAA